MAKFHLQVPADVVMLVVLLGKLGFETGAIKAAGIKQTTYEGLPTQTIDVWLVGHHVRRVTAILIDGMKTTHDSRPRRVYLIKVLTAEGEWFRVTDEDFRLNGLETPAEYDDWSYTKDGEAFRRLEHLPPPWRDFDAE